MIAEVGSGEIILIIALALVFLDMDEISLLVRGLLQIIARIKRQWERFYFELNQEVDQRLFYKHEEIEKMKSKEDKCLGKKK